VSLMPFDYLTVKLPESKKTGLNTIKIQQALDKILFSLALYPDIRLAGAFAGIKKIYNFLVFHLDDETYSALLTDVQERRGKYQEQPMMSILQNLYDLWYEDYNINELYKMITGKKIISGEEEEESEKQSPVYEREKDLKPSDYLNFSNVIEGMNVHIALEKEFNSPEVAPGIWWVVYYDRILIQSKVRPFALLARLDGGKICYLQGVWPLAYLRTALEKIVPIGYRAVHGKYVYIEVNVEFLDTKDKGKLQKYSLIRVVDSPTG